MGILLQQKQKMKERVLLLFLMIISLFTSSRASCPIRDAVVCPTKLIAAETFNTTVLKGAKYDDGAIIRAIKRNDVDVAQCLLFEEVDLNYQEPDTRKTPLMYATEYGMQTVQTGILCKNAEAYDAVADSETDKKEQLRGIIKKKLDLQDRDGNTALHLAVKEGIINSDATDGAQVIIDHIEAYSLVGSKDIQNAAGNTPLILAAQLDRQSVAKELELGAAALEADKDVQNNNGDTAVMVAARAGNLDMVSIISSGNYLTHADLNLKNRLYNQTALMIAAKAGYLDVVKFLINNGADPNVRGALGKSALDFSVSNGHPTVSHFLIDRGATYRLRGSKVSSI